MDWSVLAASGLHVAYECKMGEIIGPVMHNGQASVVLTLTGPPPKFHIPRDVGQHANGADLMHYLAGISQDENTLNNIVTVGSFLSGVAIIVFIGVQVLPALGPFGQESSVRGCSSGKRGSLLASIADGVRNTRARCPDALSLQGGAPAYRDRTPESASRTSAAARA